MSKIAPCARTHFYVAIIVLLVVFIYQSIASCCSVYAQEPEIKYKQQLGSKGSENGQFRTPHSLAVDPFGNIYVGDTGNKRIEKFYPNGTLSGKLGFCWIQRRPILGFA